MILIFDFDECAATVLNAMPKLITVNKHYAEWHYDGYRNFIIHHYAFRNGISVDSSMTCAYRTESNRIFMLKASTISSPTSMHKGKSWKRKLGTFTLSLHVSVCCPIHFPLSASQFAFQWHSNSWNANTPSIRYEVSVATVVVLRHKNVACHSNLYCIISFVWFSMGFPVWSKGSVRINQLKTIFVYICLYMLHRWNVIECVFACTITNQNKRNKRLCTRRDSLSFSDFPNNRDKNAFIWKQLH